MPIFSILCERSRPGESFSTRKALSPDAPFDLSVAAKTSSTSAIGPFVTKILLPLRMYLSPFLTAVVRETEGVGAAVRFAHGVRRRSRMPSTEPGQEFLLLRLGPVVRRAG